MSLSARYVALIMDGHSQWAERHGRPIAEGHRAGASNLIARLADAVDLGIEQLIVFEVPTRPERETVEGLQTLGEAIAAATAELMELGVRLRFIGRRDGIPAELGAVFGSAEAKTAANERISLFCGLSYDGRAEIVDAAQAFGGGGEEGFRAQLYVPEMHDPDLLIRTGGERRLSRYLLWQSAYSELIFRNDLWPDFDRMALEDCLKEFDARQRRFGARS
jgi:undecaprenyl diphosphate synthase